MNDPNSDFTCVDGECHDFKVSDKHQSKRGKIYVLSIFFFCSKCLKEMCNERKEAGNEPPVWWKTGLPKMPNMVQGGRRITP